MSRRYSLYHSRRPPWVVYNHIHIFQDILGNRYLDFPGCTVAPGPAPGLCRRCYSFAIVNSTIEEPAAPCCHGSEPVWYVTAWFINFEVFSAVGILATGE